MFFSKKKKQTIEQNGLISHYESSSIDISAINEGDPINVWEDLKSGNDGVQTGANRPVLHIDSITGKRQVRFDGVDDWLLVGKPANLDFQGQTDRWTIVAKMGENAASKGYIVSKNSSGTNGQFSFFLETSNSVDAHVGGNVSFFRDYPTVMSGDFVGAVIDTNIKYYNKNGATVGSSTNLGANMNTADVNIGGRSNGGWLFNGDMEFLAIYNRMLSDAEILEIMEVVNQ